MVVGCETSPGRRRSGGTHPPDGGRHHQPDPGDLVRRQLLAVQRLYDAVTSHFLLVLLSSQSHRPCTSVHDAPRRRIQHPLNNYVTRVLLCYFSRQRPSHFRHLTTIGRVCPRRRQSSELGGLRDERGVRDYNRVYRQSRGRGDPVRAPDQGVRE